MDKSILRILKPGLFRLSLAILVVLFHASRYFPYGDFAVNTFFILSGYWIFRMYDEFYSQQKNPYRKFIISRIFRIFPLYYFCTAMALILIVVNYSLLHHKLSDFFNFQQSFAILTIIPYNYLDEKLLPPAWSLAIELQFYLISPLLILFLKKLNGKAFFLIISLISLCGAISGLSIIQLSVIPYLIFFCCGMLIWHYKPIVSEKFLLSSIFLIIAIISLHYTIPILQKAVFIRDIWIGDFNYLILFSSVLPFLFIPFIIFNLAQKSDQKDRSLGDLSYTVYLFHWIPFSIYNYFFADSPNSIRVPAFIAYLIILILGSWIIYIFFEKRVEIFRKMILGKA